MRHAAVAEPVQGGMAFASTPHFKAPLRPAVDRVFRTALSANAASIFVSFRHYGVTDVGGGKYSPLVVLD
eukprot:645190-Pelagomonas_calceolata.AAC.2